LIRKARMSDAGALHRLAVLLNSTNLPNELSGIEEILMHSCSGFEGLYLFVLEDTTTRKVIGSSQIIARHGTAELPHIFFQIENLKCHSESLKETVEHKLLRLGFDFEGYTEVGGLILDPEYRHVPQKLGRVLSLVRFWFIQKHPENFQKRLLAELLPPFDALGKSPLWEALGCHFTRLSYQQADHFSRKQKEFIECLFPEYPINMALLPAEARAVIGKVGEGSKPAAHLLEKLGFRFEGRVDPFDGGPHFEMHTQDLPVINLDSDVKIEII